MSTAPVPALRPTSYTPASMMNSPAHSSPSTCQATFDDYFKSVLDSMEQHETDKANTIFTVLDRDILEYILTFLTGLDLCRFKSVCTASFHIVDEYMYRMFTVDRIFSPFFTPEQTILLRQIQFDTSFLVSESAAVQFFERTNYPGSDLNLYIEEEVDTNSLFQFLEGCGYTFKNSSSQPPSLNEALAAKNDWIPLSDTYREYESDYDPPWFMATFFFEQQHPSGPPIVVQVTVSTGPALAPIFDMHSTVSMNIITPMNAISLFPVSSFHLYETLVTTPNMDESEREAGLKKYSVRGWTTLRYKKVWYLDDCESPEELDAYIRHIGDEYCWTIPLPPIHGRDGITTDYFRGTYWIYHTQRSRAGDQVVHVNLLASCHE
ncbi:hypothetical protein DL96DRAFT_1774268 [Flagelloscypha sp. PMI_526]|nr:hypothetical protein DL96DRAFT_1774268 [Flagelloscypha sp. PMI_526]